MVKKILWLAGWAAGFILVAATLAFVWLVILAPGDKISEKHIEEILAVESPVFYADGRHKVGVFFQEAHRQYVPYELIPQDFVNALVAAEDRSFFSHHGVDFGGIFRALIANIKAGRVVQGGSTLTQQAAKNLFKRKDRSLVAKLKELIYAWRLEYHYPKKKIFEFYANQFYVSGNGRGLGVASRYYFDKPVDELDLLECAFIAGSVKSPNYYNPFTKRDDMAAVEARAKAKARTGYVLNQMYRLGMIDAATLQRNRGREIPFRQGRMSYSLNTIMDLVKEALETPEVTEALSAHGIENVATSGIRVITTVEKGVQEGAHAALRDELSRLDVRLRGYERQEVQQQYAGLARQESAPKVGDFLFGRIVAVDPAKSEVAVTFDLKGEAPAVDGRIDRDGLAGLVDAWAKFHRQRWSQASDADFDEFLKKGLAKGDLVYVRVRDIDLLSNEHLLGLEKYPEVEGGLLAFKDGIIRAMVGGFENRFYNRAVTAKRPMGSVIKPLVYTAALQLGWNSLDTLRNDREVFVFQKEAYFPRPDHESPYDLISMNWAGVHSENVATVWLLYHLCDHLSPAQFKEVVARLGLGQQPGESDAYYRRRIRDEQGVVVDREALGEAAFQRAVTALEPDLLFEGRMAEFEVLRSLHYGADFENYLAELEAEPEDSASDSDLAETAVRRTILKHNYLRFLALREELARRLSGAPPADPVAGFTGRLFYQPAADRYAYAEEVPGAGWRTVSEAEQQRLGAEFPAGGGENISIEGVLSVATLDQLRKAVAVEYERLAALPPYSFEVLRQVRDFRVLVALRYLIGLCRATGIESTLEPVLSFPLGSNVISLLEAARAYEAMVSGRAFVAANGSFGEAVAIIGRIEDSDGEVIYEPERRPVTVMAPETSLAVSDILRNVVRFGTGSYANRHVRLHSSDPAKEEQLQELALTMPVIGKTGTANRYTNAAFAGFLPTAVEEGSRVSLADGYVLTTYVGFDDNTPMVRTSTHITGSSGALPLWTRLANSILRQHGYADELDLVDFYFENRQQVPLHYPALGQIELKVEADNGGRASAERAGAVEAGANPTPTVAFFGTIGEDGRIRPMRYFQPYWREQEKTE